MMDFLLPNAQSLATEFPRERFVVVRDLLPRAVAYAWRVRADDLSRRHGIAIRRDGPDRLSYAVVTGNVVREQWPELYAFYASPEMRDWVKAVTGAERIFTSPHPASAININRLDTTEHIYRWHYDAEPFTLLLYLTDAVPEAGGALQIQKSDGWVLDVLPASGMGVLMDGTVCRHRVAPLTHAELRLSIPLVYPTHEHHARPEGLDDYLYTAWARG